jgi:hypothetical protein
MDIPSESICFMVTKTKSVNMLCLVDISIIRAVHFYALGRWLIGGSFMLTFVFIVAIFSGAQLLVLGMHACIFSAYALQNDGKLCF